MIRLRLRSERGAVAVEAALVTPLVMALIFGLVEFGFFFKDYLSTSSAVRTGVRVASANPRYAGYAQATADRVQFSGSALSYDTVQELWVYKANPTNDFPIGYSDFSTCATCTKFQWDGTKFVPIAGSTWASDTQVACVGAGGPPDRIGVYMKVRHDAITGFVFSTLTISESAVMRLEPIPPTNGCR
jgi:Flp pilus assembly protein TadG